MRFRHLVLAAAIIAAFVYLTTYSPMRPFGPGNWRGPLPWERGATPVSNVTLAQGERFSPDEQNNIEVYKAASPAVVNITTVTLAYDFFLNAVPVESGAGSGFLIDADGDIVTNYHVISGARQVQVTMADKSRFKAQVVGADPRSDLAVVRVSAEKKLPYLQLGDSKNLQVGQKVLAIGNPFGQFQNTLTTGVISSLGRSVRDPESRNVLEDVIQTDAAINPGNSGGPLLDIEGKMIGINSAMIPFAQGIGFAIPIDQVKEIVDDIVKFGHVRRLWLGIIAMPNNKEVAQYYSLPTEKGVIAARIVIDGPAHVAGIAPGDIVLEVAGMKLKEVNDIRKALKGKHPGDSVEVKIVHAGEQVSVMIRLKEQPNG